MQAKGFTLMEVVLAIALISVLVMLSVPFYRSYQLRNDLEIAATITVQSLRRAQALAQAGASDAAWGVYVQSMSITLFQGASYATRVTDFDETFEIPEIIEISGTQEFVFSGFTGLPQSTGTLILTSVNNQEEQISVNSKGTVSY